jgi:hydrogenase maturation factor HypF (carbamoyltransferase family)
MQSPAGTMEFKEEIISVKHDALLEAVYAIKSEKIVAVKGIGGFT